MSKTKPQLKLVTVEGVNLDTETRDEFIARAHVFRRNEIARLEEIGVSYDEAFRMAAFEFAGMVCSWDIAKFPADDPSRNDAKLGRLRKELTTLVAEINAGKQSPDGSVTDEAGDRELALRWQIATIPAAGLGGIIVKLETACDDFLPASLGWHINDLDIAQRILYEALRDAERLAEG